MYRFKFCGLWYLFFHLLTNELNLKFLEHYMKSIANDIKGRATGKVHFYGKFKGLNLDGAVMTDASMNFDILNTHFLQHQDEAFLLMFINFSCFIYLSYFFKLIYNFFSCPFIFFIFFIFEDFKGLFFFWYKMWRRLF